MSEFHRIVTYLYLYESGHKSRNTGYAKIEKRDAQCRVEIHMKNTGYHSCDCPVYFYTKNGEHFEGISIGSMRFTQGSCDWKEILDVAVLNGVKGIFLPLSENEMILSQWDDTAFDRNLFHANTDDTSAKDAVFDTSAAPACESSKDTANNPVEEAPADSPAQSADLKAAEAALVLPEPEISLSEAAKLDFLMENFPSVLPFSMEDSFRWVRLELKDLKLLPESCRFLANNSFLLHGFFNYHHLILGKSGAASSTRRTLGVPGVFQNPESVMAALFGFPDFQSAAESDCKTGHFGYWLRPLE